MPSLDLTQGRAVRLERGDLARQKPYANDAAEVIALARWLTGAGASRLHLVDLDAATGKGDNR
ncbi:MAG: HisA/HisF-related TIM barrel protein, partial [Candidatus Dormibacteraeota bacterium]|nr:HisA/HisF-related TIM barrel protein [Candidatus Dormibacteraeota bacterium]